MPNKKTDNKKDNKQEAADPENVRKKLAESKRLGRLNRTREVEPDYAPEPPKVSGGPVDKVIDYAFNSTREKIREMTVIDKMQGRLFPLLDMINAAGHYILAVALYRQNPDLYASSHPLASSPIPPNLQEELMYRTAQWQKSVGGKNLDRAIDIALAETEMQSGDDDDGSKHADGLWKE